MELCGGDSMEGGVGWPIAIIGMMLLAGYVAHMAGPRIHIPRVTLLLLAGAIFGPSVLDVVPEDASKWFDFVAHMALAMIGFLLGESFLASKVRRMGSTVLWVAMGETLAAAAAVFSAVWAVSGSLPLALVLAGIAPASAPAAIFETIREGKAKGPLTDTVLGIVAIDDAWGVVLFSVFLVVAQSVSGAGTHFEQLWGGLWEIGGAVLLGGAVSLPMLWITRRVRDGEPTLVEAAGFVFLCSGLATVMGVSYLLACMVLGTVLANCRSEKLRPFHAIEGVREPFLAVFFILAGLKLDVGTLTQLGWIGLAYVAARTSGKIVGGNLAGRLADAPAPVKRRVGFCLMPQAGVALGFALLAQKSLPTLGEKVLPLIIATTVLFEITGPLVARWQLRAAGELAGTNRGGTRGRDES